MQALNFLFKDEFKKIFVRPAAEVRCSPCHSYDAQSVGAHFICRIELGSCGSPDRCGTALQQLLISRSQATSVCDIHACTYDA